MQPAWLKLAPTDYTIAIHSETAGQTQQPWFNKWLSNKWLSDGGIDAAQLYWCWTRRLTDVKGFIYALFVVLGPWAMPETFIIPRARAMLGGRRPPSGLSIKGERH